MAPDVGCAVAGALLPPFPWSVPSTGNVVKPVLAPELPLVVAAELVGAGKLKLDEAGFELAVEAAGIPKVNPAALVCGLEPASDCLGAKENAAALVEAVVAPPPAVAVASNENAAAVPVAAAEDAAPNIEPEPADAEAGVPNAKAAD